MLSNSDIYEPIQLRVKFIFLVMRLKKNKIKDVEFIAIRWHLYHLFNSLGEQYLYQDFVKESNYIILELRN